MNLENLTTREKIKVYGQEMIDLYLSGSTTRAIAKKFKIPAHDSISNFLKRSGITVRPWKIPVDWIDEENIKCSRCFTIKNKNEYPFSKSNNRDGYYFSFCKACRAHQTKINRINRSHDFIERCGKIKLRAEKFGIPFDLTPEFLKEMFEQQEGKCFYTGNELILELGNGIRPNSCSVDKVNPTGGYTKDNIVICSNRANTIKHNMSMDEMREWMPSWYQKIVEKFGDF